MRRKGKREFRLGFAVAGALVALALIASAAIAQDQNGRISAKGPFYLNGRALKGGTVLSFPLGEEVACSRSRERWEQLGGGPIRSSASVFTVTPTYSGCSAGRGLYGATVAMNGCDYVFHVGETVNVQEYELNAGLSCPAGRRAVMRIFIDSEVGSFLACTVRLGARPKITGARLLDQKGNRALVEGTMTGLRDSKGGLCGFGTSPTVRYWISLELEGVSAAGRPTEAVIDD